MVHQPPAGARDLLPLEVTQKAWINDRLQTVFQQWGYQRLVTSTIEWLDTLIAGGAIDRSTVIQLQETERGQLGLRPELTASIARTAVTRLADSTHPQRLCYRANVFRQPPAGYHGRQLEFYQAGVELLCVGGVLADTEILILLAECLEQLGVPQWQVILGDAGLTRSLLSPFPEPLRAQVCHCIAHLDHVALKALNYPSQSLRQRALSLFDLRGNPGNVLQAVISLDIDETARQSVKNLKSLVDLLEDSRQAAFPLTLDLSLLQTFDYYTGIVFKAVAIAQNQWRILGQGGRYDRLLGVYHPQQQSAPGIGFSLNIEDLHACLLTTNVLPQTPPPINWLVVAQTPQAQAAAFRYAQILRKTDPSLRVEVDLGGCNRQDIRDYARARRIKGLAWVQTEETATVELL